MSMRLNAVRCCAAAVTLVCGAPALAEEFYVQHNLVSDGFVPADHNTDTNLVNAWGLVFNPQGPAWVANNGTGTSTLYDGNGVAVPAPPAMPLVVKIPGPGGATGTPTGIVFNASKNFTVTENSTTGASAFIFATEDGLIAGWAPSVDVKNAVVAVDNSASGAVYKGLALGANGSGNRLYATNFHNGTVDVFDSSFKPVTNAGAFVDPELPNGYAPFGIQIIAGDVFVTYAVQQQPARHDEVDGRGLGIVDVYDANGKLLRRLASHGELNAPWGLALAPEGFGELRGSLLVGNFGDGKIHAYTLHSGDFLGPLESADDQPIQIQGLWGLSFGSGFANAPADTLYFTAGPGGESHGLYGRIDVKPSSH
ncbi:MAG: TIGR03118 family protein [Nevskia sp.]|nr:TIGR03118 family protein [Nevskia sp.]